jgi:NADH-quinone oxidoreductase subunit C
MTTAQLAEKIKQRFPNLSQTEFRDEISVQVPLEQIELACQICRDELGFDFLVDISSVDHFGEEPRFDIVYELYSLEQNIHLRLKTKVSEDRLEVPTISRLWEGANWHEREIFDMMGIHFANHPDLRRILMWDGYPYFPLRKDFPLEGKPSNMPDVAFSDVAPLAGGPFVTAPTTTGTKDREPRAHPPE